MLLAGCGFFFALAMYLPSLSRASFLLRRPSVRGRHSGRFLQEVALLRVRSKQTNPRFVLFLFLRFLFLSAQPLVHLAVFVHVPVSVSVSVSDSDS